MRNTTLLATRSLLRSARFRCQRCGVHLWAAVLTLTLLINTLAATAATYIWNGNINGNWDTSTANWLAGTNSALYSDGNATLFDDTLTGTTNVVLSLIVNPSAVTFSNSTHDYLFSGSGRISGATSLVKNGSGAVTLTGTGGDNFSGGVIVNDGKLTLDNPGSSMSGGMTIGNSGTLQIGNGEALSWGLLGTAAVNGTLIFNLGSATYSWSGISGNGTVVKQGTSVLTLSNTTTNLVDVAILVSGGTLKAGTNALGSANAGTTISSGATLDINAQNLGPESITVSGPGVAATGAIINSSATAQQNALQFVTLAGPTTFGGTGRWDIRSTPITSVTTTLSTSGNGYKLTKAGANQISLVGVNVDSALGDIDVVQGILSFEKVTTSMGNPANALTVFSSASLQFFQASNVLSKVVVLRDSATIINSSGLNVFAGPITLGTNGVGAGGNCTFNIGGNYLWLNNGQVNGTGNLIKTGTGILYISGANPYSGNTTVNAGMLSLFGNGTMQVTPLITIASGAIVNSQDRSDHTLTLGSGQTLQGNGTVFGKLTAAAGSTVRPGTTAAAGTLFVSDAVTMLGTTFMKLNVTTGTNDVLRAPSITYGGTLSITNQSGSLSSGALFKVFNAGSYAGSFSSIVPATPGVGLVWDTTPLSNGYIAVAPASGIAIYRQPQSITRFAGGVASFSLLAGSQPVTYQWFLGTNALSGQTNSTLTLNSVQSSDAGGYTCRVTNPFGTLFSSSASLTVLQVSNSYPQTVLGDNPISYWRLNEGNGSPAATATNGAVAHDYIGTQDGIYTTNVVLGAPPYSVADPDSGALFGTLGTSNSFVGSVNGIDFSLQGGNAQFSIETWVRGNLQTTDNGIVTLGYGGGGEQFSLDAGSGSRRWRFFVRDATGAASTINGTTASDGNWHHLVGVCDQAGGSIKFYLDGVLNGTASITSGAGVLPSTAALNIGARKSGVSSTNPDLQWIGSIDDVAIYNYALSAAQVSNHYQTGLGILPQPQNQTAVIGSNAVFTVGVTGAPLVAVQWTFNGTNLAGTTSASLNLTNVQLATAGYYRALVTTPYWSDFSAIAGLGVNGPLTNSNGSVSAPSGMIDWWAAEGNALDSVGGNHGTPINTLSYGPGKVGSAFQFDGTNTRIDLNASNVPPPWTVSAWVNRQNSPNSSAALMGDTSFSIKLEQFNGTRQVGITTFGTGGLDLSFGYVAPTGTWVHLAFVATVTNTLLYTNGVLQGALAVSAPLPRASIGADFNGALDHMAGSVDELAIFNRALNGSEVNSLYTAGNAGQFVGSIPPAILAQPQSQFRNRNQTASFSVTAVGLPLPSYQWQFNGSDLGDNGRVSGAQSSSLVISNVALADAGAFRVIVSNSLGSVTSAIATLTVPASIVDSFSSSNEVGSGALAWHVWYQNSPAALQNLALDPTTDASGQVNSGAMKVVASFAGAGHFAIYNGTFEASLFGSNYASLEMDVRFDPSSPTRGGNDFGLLQFGTQTGASNSFSPDWFGTAVIPATNTGWVHVSAPINVSLDPNQAEIRGLAIQIDGNRGDNVLNGTSTFWIDNVTLTLSPSGQTNTLPPIILGNPQSKAVAVNGSTGFDVRATGAGSLTYQWLFNGTNLPGATASFLSIQNAQSNNVGSYQSRVTNPYGTATSAVATLTVTSTPPLITSQPQDLIVAAGTPLASFAVNATGATAYQWSKDGVIIPGATDSTYSIANAQLADAGGYNVQVISASQGTNSATASLSVVAGPLSRNVAAGSKTVFAASAAGTGPFTYQWGFNNVAVAGATRSSLTLTNVQPSNAGTWSVSVSNSVGGLNLAATLGVIPGSIQLAPTNLVVIRVGDGAQSLTTGGNSAFLDQFTTSGAYLNTVAVPDGGSNGVVMSGGSFVEGYLTRSLDGRLLCFAAYGTNAGAVADVTTSTSVPRVVVTFSGSSLFTRNIVTTTDYSGLNFRSAATDGTNNFWGAGSGGGTIYLGAGAPRAVIQNSKPNCRVVELFNGNLYMASASNLGDTFRGLYVFSGLPRTATPLPAPIIFTNTFTSPNGINDFAVSPSGTIIYFADDRTPNGIEGGIQRWDFDGVNNIWTNSYRLAAGLPAVGANNLVVDWSGPSPVLYATTPGTSQNQLVSATDTGPASTFSILATAGANQIFRGVKFGPVPDPTIIAQPQSLTNTVGSTAIFSVGASGTPPLTYQWQKNGTNLAGATLSSLTLSNVSQSNAGSYLVIVSNAFGSASSTVATLSVGTAPVVTNQPQDQVVGVGGTATLTAAASGSAPLNYQWQQNGVNVFVATQSTLSIANASLANAGTYRVLVSNPFGSKVSSNATLLVFTAPNILQPPIDAQVTEGASVTFSVLASSSGPLTYQWSFNGSNIAAATGTAYTVNNAQLSNSGDYTVQVANAALAATATAALLVVPVPPPPPPPVQATYSIQIRPGLNLIANQVDHGVNTLRDLMPTVPNGTVVSKYDNLSATWVQDTFHAASNTWSPGIVVLQPGEGAFMQSPSNSLLTITGNPHVPVLPLVIPPGVAWLVSRQTNDIGTYENITGLSPTPGAVVYQWNPTNSQYMTNSYTALGWSPGVPVAATGESLWIGPAGGAPVPLPDAPVITQHPSPFSVAQGGTAIFTVIAVGSDLQYQWRLNENNIPGATGSSLTISNVQPADGGNYSVVVFNVIGVAISTNAPLTVTNLPPLPSADNFANAGDLGSANAGTFSGSTIGATIEQGEHPPANITGGASIWLRWQPLASGLATFTTAGSDFDTLLAVYTGSSLASLHSVVADDDSADFLCSRVGFNAVAGTTYYIQIDGFYGVSGHVILAWNNTLTNQQAPEIVTQPQSQTVPSGTTVFLTVAVTNTGSGVSYRWTHDGAPVASGTDSSLAVPNVAVGDAGLYRVGITNLLNGLGVISMAANIQIFDPGIGQAGNPANVALQDKFPAANDLTVPDPNFPRNPVDDAVLSGYGGTITAGGTGAYTVDPGETEHCGYAPHKSVWGNYSNNVSGRLTITTRGTTFNAVLAVYTGPDISRVVQVPGGCSSGHGVTSGEVVTVDYTNGVNYRIVVQPVNTNSSGTVVLTYSLVANAGLATAPVSQIVSNGAKLTLTAVALGTPPVTYQWRLNGQDLSDGPNMSGTHSSSLIISSLTDGLQGQYTLVTANGFSTNESAPALVFFGNPPQFIRSWVSRGVFNAQLACLARTNYVIEASSDLKTWSTVKTSSDAFGYITLTDPVTTTNRFYRARKL